MLVCLVAGVAPLDVWQLVAMWLNESSAISLACSHVALQTAFRGMSGRSLLKMKCYLLFLNNGLCLELDYNTNDSSVESSRGNYVYAV